MPEKKAVPGSFKINNDSVTINYIKYNYNPYTGNLPSGNWIYYKYENDGTSMSFDHKITNLDGRDVWFLVGGPGGAGGRLHTKAAGSGGGGGPGELVLSVWTKPTTTDANTDTFKILIEPNNYDRNTNFYRFNRVSYKAESSDSSSSDVALAVYGLNGSGSYHYGPDNSSVNNTGYNGGQGGYNTDANSLATQTFTFTSSNLGAWSGITPTDTKITTYRFGSGYGGGGDGNQGKGKGELGNQSVVSGTTYYLQVNNARARTGGACNVDFGKTLDGKQCDNTGIVALLKGGDGGKTSNVKNNKTDKASVGYHGPIGFVMIFYKTTVAL